MKKFELQIKTREGWKTIHTGQGLGAHFKAAFDPVTTSAIRLNILDASKGPTISDIYLIETSE